MPTTFSIRATFVVALAATAGASADPLAFTQGYDRVEVADGITAFIAHESPGGVVQGNIVAISGKSATLVVDSGQYPSLAKRIVAELKADGAAPVRWLVNTHWHGDHLLANHVFVEAWPNVVTIQHVETQRLARKNYAKWATEGVQQTRDFMTAVEAGLKRGATSKGVKLTEDQIEGYSIDLHLARQWIAEADQTRWTPADLAIADELRIDLGGREIVVRKPGRANTPGDLVVFDEQTRTLATGDIVVHPTPYSFGSYHSDWIDTLAALRKLGPTRIVPGHGAVMRDAKYLEQLEALLAETRTQVRAAVAKGLTLEQVRKQVTLGEQETIFAGDDPLRRRAFRQFYLEPGIERAYLEAKGEPLDE